MDDLLEERARTVRCCKWERVGSRGWVVEKLRREMANWGLISKKERGVEIERQYITEIGAVAIPEWRRGP